MCTRITQGSCCVLTRIFSLESGVGPKNLHNKLPCEADVASPGITLGGRNKAFDSFVYKQLPSPLRNPALVIPGTGQAAELGSTTSFSKSLLHEYK